MIIYLINFSISLIMILYQYNYLLLYLTTKRLIYLNTFDVTSKRKLQTLVGIYFFFFTKTNLRLVDP